MGGATARTAAIFLRLATDPSAGPARAALLLFWLCRSTAGCEADFLQFRLHHFGVNKNKSLLLGFFESFFYQEPHFKGNSGLSNDRMYLEEPPSLEKRLENPGGSKI